MRTCLSLKLKNRCCRSARKHIKCRLSTHSPKIASCDRNNLNHVHTQNTFDDNQNLYLLLTTVFWSLNWIRSGKVWKSIVLSQSGFFGVTFSAVPSNFNERQWKSLQNCFKYRFRLSTNRFNFYRAQFRMNHFQIRPPAEPMTIVKFIHDIPIQL